MTKDEAINYAVSQDSNTVFLDADGKCVILSTRKLSIVLHEDGIFVVKSTGEVKEIDFDKL